VIHGKPIEKQVLLCGVNISPLILLLALGFHSIFEGIALGMQKTVGPFVNLMIGVCIHHAVACISLGVQLGQHQTKSKKAIFFIFFALSLIESAGIGIGIGIESAPIMVTSIVMSLAGGTFIYIACSEILIHEFSVSTHRYWKFLFFLIGCASITLLWFLHSEHEGEEGGDHDGHDH
jgi:zinc transporter 1/2/3